MNTVRAMMQRRVRSVATYLGVFALVAVGCRSLGRTDAGSPPSSLRPSRSGDIHGVVCLFDQKPWLNVDAAGDPDPEGIRYRVFLDPGKGKCVLREGSFRIEMYQIDRTGAGDIERTLVSDWNYPTSELGTVLSKILGKGYHLQLRWAKKETAGHEIEVITQFIDRYGNTTRSPTKRLRVPKYSS
ncbi:MAG: hypothetical protein AAB363_09540 [Planctomycetota bacterium]